MFGVFENQACEFFYKHTKKDSVLKTKCPIL